MCNEPLNESTFSFSNAPKNPVIHSAFVTLLMVDLLFQRGRGVDKPTRDTKL